MRHLFLFFKRNPELLNQDIFTMTIENLENLRLYIFGQKTPNDMKQNPLIIEETAQTILRIINPFKPYQK